MSDLKCEAGCNHFYGGEIKHDKNCVFYPESRTEMYDKALQRIEQLEELLDGLARDHDYTKQPYSPSYSSAPFMRISYKLLDWARLRNIPTPHHDRIVIETTPS